MKFRAFNFGPGPKFSCQFTDCKISGPADKMWNIGGTEVVLCSQHAHAARERGEKAYRLSQTISYQEKRLAEEKERADHFFANIRELSHEPRKNRDRR